MSTRSSNILCPIVGTPQKLNNRMLPTFNDVMKHTLFVRQNLKTGSKLPPVKDAFDVVASDLLLLWEYASIPAISKNRIIAMLQKNYDNQRKLLKSKNSKKIKAESFENNIQKFKEECKKLFDISACKCPSLKNCTCVAERTVPEEEKEFLIDQRSERQMVIGEIDRATTARREKSYVRKVLDESRMICASHSGSVIDEAILTGTSSSETSDADESEYEPCASTKRRFEAESTEIDNEPKINMRKIALLSDKTGVSDRATATIASAVLEAANLINKDNPKCVLDRHRVRRAKKRARTELQLQPKVIEALESIYFDGRKDATRIQDGQNHVKIIKEEHISIIQEPGSHFVCHVTPQLGTARCISSTIMDYFVTNDIDTSKVTAVGCDGTAVNTGQKGGIIKLLEEKLNTPVHWFVCLLHTNELPLRHLIQTIDGKTCGPSSFTGEIGRKLQDCEKRDIVQFEPVESEPIDIDAKDLSCDQKYLLMIYRAVSSGICPDELKAMNPGTMHHARWLTTANRILRYYVSCDEPTDGLQILVKYIIKVYAPVWFAVKSQPSASEGAKHFFKLIQSSRFLPEDYREVVDKTLSHNSYFAHSENLLLAMLCDNSFAIRELAARRIIKARVNTDGHGGSKGLRKFTLPTLQFNAPVYHLMIDWQHAQLEEPPMTKGFELDYIRRVIIEEHGYLPLTNFVCHTQAVERMIKMVTEASCTVVGEKARDGLIRARLEGRKILPVFESKKDFVMSQ